MNRDEAIEALGAVDEARDRLAQAMDCPPWRHAAFGAIMAAMIAANALPRPFFAPLFVLSMAATVWLIRWDRQRSGTFINALRRGRTLPLTALLFAVLLGLIFMAHRGSSEAFVTGRGLAAIALAFVVSTAASVAWQRIYVAELRGRAGA